ncbi:MAG TPA: hypothetical protein VFH33_04765, partial [Candidatus Krumholzibacteria bacterium]|nr:hypothetical protein [Candidatus Krumholzibacteria bacterium]
MFGAQAKLRAVVAATTRRSFEPRETDVKNSSAAKIRRSTESVRRCSLQIAAFVRSTTSKAPPAIKRRVFSRGLPGGRARRTIRRRGPLEAAPLREEKADGDGQSRCGLGRRDRSF